MNISELVIDTKGLSKTYNGVAALDSLNLQVPKNSIFDFFVTIILVQGLVAYVQLTLSDGSPLPLPPYLAILALLSLYLLFYLALTLMLGTFFDTSGPVLGIAMVVAIGSMLGMGNLFAGFLPWIVVLLPESIPGILTFLVQGETLPDIWPIPFILMSVYSLLFVALAIWRIKREEF
ncbi:hypothetical protein ACFLY4_05290 [Chloroflexota bacterium]